MSKNRVGMLLSEELLEEILGRIQDARHQVWCSTVCRSWRRLSIRNATLLDLSAGSKLNADAVNAILKRYHEIRELRLDVSECRGFRLGAGLQNVVSLDITMREMDALFLMRTLSSFPALSMLRLHVVCGNEGPGNEPDEESNEETEEDSLQGMEELVLPLHLPCLRLCEFSRFPFTKAPAAVTGLFVDGICPSLEELSLRHCKLPPSLRVVSSSLVVFQLLADDVNSQDLEVEAPNLRVFNMQGGSLCRIWIKAPNLKYLRFLDTNFELASEFLASLMACKHLTDFHFYGNLPELIPLRLEQLLQSKPELEVMSMDNGLLCWLCYGAEVVPEVPNGPFPRQLRIVHLQLRVELTNRLGLEEFHQHCAQVVETLEKCCPQVQVFQYNSASEMIDKCLAPRCYESRLLVLEKRGSRMVQPGLSLWQYLRTRD